MTEPKRFAAIFILAGFALAAYYYVFTEKENFTLKNGTAALTGDETPPRNQGAHPAQDTLTDDRTGLTQFKYDSIETGMTYEEVYAILRSHGTESHRDGHDVVYRWTYETQMLLVTFRDEKVSDKRFTENPERVHSSK